MDLLVMTMTVTTLVSLWAIGLRPALSSLILSHVLLVNRAPSGPTVTPRRRYVYQQ